MKTRPKEYCISEKGDLLNFAFLLTRIAWLILKNTRIIEINERKNLRSIPTISVKYLETLLDVIYSNKGILGLFHPKMNDQ